MTKNILHTEYSFDFCLVGLVCIVKEYKLVWHINQILDLNLVKKEDLVLKFRDNIEISISNFLYKTENSRIELIKNRLISSSGTPFQYLLEELKQFDYLLKIEDETEETDMKRVLSFLKSVPVIEYATNLEPTLIKSRYNLIF